jgi:hypothetical protein
MIMVTHRKFSNSLECYSTHQRTRRIFNEKCKALVKENLSLCLYPKISSTIASGATTIGSTEHAPDDIIEQNKQLREGCKEKFT